MAVQTLLDRLPASAGATRVSVCVHETSTHRVVPYRQSVAASSELTGRPQVQTAVALGQSPFLGRVIRDRQPVQAHATGRRAADRELEGLGILSAHGHPLILDGEVIGVLTVEPAAAAAPHLLRKAAPPLAVALAAAWTRRVEQRGAAHAEVLLGLIESAARARSMDQLLGDACRTLAQLGEVERASIFLVEDDRLVPRMAGGVHDRRDPAAAEQFRNAPVGLELAEAVLRTGEPMTAERDSGLLAGWWADDFGIVSALAVPLGRSPHPAGVLVLDSSQLQPFSEDVRRLAAAAGAHLGAVLAQTGDRLG